MFFLGYYSEDVTIFQNKRVLIHCANGHGRSALFVAILLKDLNLVDTLYNGLEKVKKNRRLAVPNGTQLKSIL